MPHPLTLLEIAGATPVPARFDDAILVLIDAQNEYRSGRLPLAGVEPAIAEAALLLARARQSNRPVIHVVHGSAPGAALFDPATSAGEIIDELKPSGNEAVVVKRLPNAFAGTTLAQELAALKEGTGRTELVLIGFMTHMCVGATARAALDLGWKSTIVAGATATRDLPDPLGGAIPAETVHRTALAELADRFAVVVPSAASLA